MIFNARARNVRVVPEVEEIVLPTAEGANYTVREDYELARR